MAGGAELATLIFFFRHLQEVKPEDGEDKKMARPCSIKNASTQHRRRASASAQPSSVPHHRRIRDLRGECALCVAWPSARNGKASVTHIT